MNTMKTRITVVIASLLAASLGTAAYAQNPPATPPPTQTPQTMRSPTTTDSPANSTKWQSHTTDSHADSAKWQSHTMGNHPDSTMSQSSTARQIQQQLSTQGIAMTRVEVTFNDGTAVLSGSVPKQQDISVAKSAAMRVPGVKDVNTSRLRVQRRPVPVKTRGNGTATG